jgi:hypothetical protein
VALTLVAVVGGYVGSRGSSSARHMVQVLFVLRQEVAATSGGGWCLHVWWCIFRCRWLSWRSVEVECQLSY